MKADINNLKDTLTQSQYNSLVKDKVRFENEVMTYFDFIKLLIGRGYKITRGDKNSYRIENNRDIFLILNAAQAKLFNTISKGGKGDIKPNGLSTYKIY